MAETKIKAGQFYGVIGHGTDGYFLMTNADGSMSWSQASTGPSVTSVTYPGDDTAADPAGGQTVVLTGTGFGSSMTVSIGGTTAPSVSHDSSTQLTITTPAKAAGDYDIVVTNSVTGASGTFVNGISYNGVPTWTTAAGSLGTFDSNTTISTITLQATETDGGTITFNITNGALPTGLSLTGANIDGTTTTESSTTLYSFTIEAIDDENQSTPRNFSITVNAALVNTDNFDIVTYTGTGGTYSIGNGVEASVTLNSGTANYARGSVSHSTGKRYFEVEYISKGGGSNTLMVGIINTAYQESWTNAQTKMYYAGNGNKYTGGSGTSYGATYAPGDIIGVAYDGTNRTVTFYKNNVSQGTAFTGLITNYPSYFAAIGTGLYSETAQFRFTTSEFTYSPPSGYSEWGSATVSAHSGTVNSAVAAQPIDFQPDLVWIKDRDGTDNHHLFDSIRGTNQRIMSNQTSAENTEIDCLNSFDSNGFSIGANSGVNANGENHVAWCWKAGGTAVSNTDGSITSQVSANQEAGFSIVSYDGATNSTSDTSINGGAYWNVGHGLSEPPELVIVKCRDASHGWYVGADVLNSGDWTNNHHLILQRDVAVATNSTPAGILWGYQNPTSTTFGVGGWDTVNRNGLSYIAYCFHSVDGYQKVGSYTGTGTTNSFTGFGFQPRWIMIKRTDSTGNWWVFDSVRGNNKGLRVNLSNAEGDTDDDANTYEYRINFLSDGFQYEIDDSTSASPDLNVSSGTYIYLAIA